MSASHEVSPLIKLVPRGDTTVADAYLSPVLRRYVDRGRRASSASESPNLLFMASSGGLKAAQTFRGRDAILSGPAGGVVGMAETAQARRLRPRHRLRHGRHVDRCRAFRRRVRARVRDARSPACACARPMLRVHTVAAGGGSILPTTARASASARTAPAPIRARAAIAAAARSTVTDANVMLGKLTRAFFPRSSAPAHDQPLDADARARRLRRSCRARSATAARRRRSPTASSASPSRTWPTPSRRSRSQRGYDVTDTRSTASAGAGGQHACLIADTLGIETVLVHPLSGLLSAYGMGLAQHARAAASARSRRRSTTRRMHELEASPTSSAARRREELLDQGVEHDAIAIESFAHLRYAGTDTALPVPLSEPRFMRRDFEALHRQRFGFVSPEKRRSSSPRSSRGRSCRSAARASPQRGDRSASPPRRTAEPHGADDTAPRFYSRGRVARGAGRACANARARRRARRPRARHRAAPDRRRRARLDAGRSRANDHRPHAAPSRASANASAPTADPVLLEVFNNLFMAIAEQMGEALRNTAQSVNIKERLDFSCAVFDADGALVANAPHMPVHLGSMDRSVETIIRAARRRDAPRRRLHAQRALQRRHAPARHHRRHAGVRRRRRAPCCSTSPAAATTRTSAASRPGSMTPRATTIDEEGVYIDNVQAGRRRPLPRGRDARAADRRAAPGAPPDKNIADLKAQVAANAKGEAELQPHGRALRPRRRAGLHAATCRTTPRRACAACCRALDDGHFRVETDQGAAVEVRITVDREKPHARRSTSPAPAPQQRNNFNAPEPVTRAAVLYIFRVMVDEPIPMNAGCLKPIEIVIPEGSMLQPAPIPPPSSPATSRPARSSPTALFAALGALRPAQGTMNNLTFGNDRRQYYETLCSGGAGAGPASTAPPPCTCT